jgi:hypothetical protein
MRLSIRCRQTELEASASTLTTTAERSQESVNKPVSGNSRSGCPEESDRHPRPTGWAKTNAEPAFHDPKKLLPKAPSGGWYLANQTIRNFFDPS